MISLILVPHKPGPSSGFSLSTSCPTHSCVPSGLCCPQHFWNAPGGTGVSLCHTELGVKPRKDGIPVGVGLGWMGVGISGGRGGCGSSRKGWLKGREDHINRETHELTIPGAQRFPSSWFSIWRILTEELFWGIQSNPSWADGPEGPARYILQVPLGVSQMLSPSHDTKLLGQPHKSVSLELPQLCCKREWGQRWVLEKHLVKKRILVFFWTANFLHSEIIPLLMRSSPT